jgi:hypothetical protein
MAHSRQGRKNFPQLGFFPRPATKVGIDSGNDSGLVFPHHSCDPVETI